MVKSENYVPIQNEPPFETDISYYDKKYVLDQENSRKFLLQELSSTNLVIDKDSYVVFKNFECIKFVYSKKHNMIYISKPLIFNVMTSKYSLCKTEFIDIVLEVFMNHLKLKAEKVLDVTFHNFVK
jgi:hypothetical protein